MLVLQLSERLAFEPIAGYISSSRDERVWTGAVSGWRDLTIAVRDEWSGARLGVLSVGLGDADNEKSSPSKRPGVIRACAIAIS